MQLHQEGVELGVCERIGLIGFELNSQTLDYLVWFFGLKFSIQLKNLISSIFIL
jgi:hypothetical protein